MAETTPIQPAQVELIKAFRFFFPEFTEDKYPDLRLYPALILARNTVSKERWGEMYAYGISLVIAHYLMSKDKSTDSEGNPTDKGDLVTTSKSVGGVSVSYTLPTGNTSTTSYGSGFASTSYGREYLNLANLYGMGVIAL